MRKGYLAVLSVSLAGLASLATWARHPLTFEERVKAQEAIERVCLEHGLERQPQLRQERDSGADSLLLEPVPAGLYQAAESSLREATDTPQLLTDLLKALGQDPALVEACLLRPALAESARRAGLLQGGRLVDQRPGLWARLLSPLQAPDFLRSWLLEGNGQKGEGSPDCLPGLRGSKGQGAGSGQAGKWVQAAPDTETTSASWIRLFGAAPAVQSPWLSPLSGSGYLVSAGVTGAGAGARDGLLIGTDSSGYPLWQKAYGTTLDDYLNVFPRASGLIPFDGFSQQSAPYSSTTFMGMMTSDGTVSWSSSLPQNHRVNKRFEDGSQLIVGYSAVASPVSTTITIAKVTSSGAVAWSRTYTCAVYLQSANAWVTSSGDIYVYGLSDPAPNSYLYDTQLIRLDASGALVWARSLGGSGIQQFYMSGFTGTGAILLAGYVGATSSATEGCYLRVSDQGQLLQGRRTVGESYITVDETPEGNLLCSDHTLNGSVWTTKVFCVSSAGSLLWARRLYPDGNFVSATPLASGELFAEENDYNGGRTYYGLMNSSAQSFSWQRLYGQYGFVERNRETENSYLLHAFSIPEAGLLDSTGQVSGTTCIAPASHFWVEDASVLLEDYAPAVTSLALTEVTSNFQLTPYPLTATPLALPVAEVCASLCAVASATAAPTQGCAPLTVSFTGGVTGGVSPFTWAWSFGDGGASGQQSPTHTYAGGGSFTASLTVSDSSGCQASTSVGPITASAMAMPTVTGASGGCASSGVILSTQGYYGYQWFKDGTAIGGATGQSYAATASGTYSVQVTDAQGCVGTSAGKAVTVNANPTPTATAGAPACGSVTVSTGSYASYQWYRNSVLISGATSQTYAATQSGTYSVAVTDANGCQGTSSGVAVTVYPLPTPSVGGPTTGCERSGVTLTTGSYSSYLWHASPVGTTHGLLVSATCAGTAGNDYYYDVLASPAYTIQTGDVLEYDIYGYVTNPEFRAAVDLIALGWVLRGSGAVDQNGLGAQPGTDLSSRMAGKWYHRSIAIPSSGVGKSLSGNGYGVFLGIEDEAAGSYNVYVTNLKITNGGVPQLTVYGGGASFTFPSDAGYSFGSGYTVSIEAVIPGGAHAAGTTSCLARGTGDYRVYVTDGNGCGAWSAPYAVTLNPGPASPGDTLSVIRSGSAAALGWSACAGATSYLVMKNSAPGTNPNGFTTVGTPATNSYADGAAISAGQVWWYKVEASDGTCATE